jgi:NTP pyrophosphatase (non-canonical NTP hydrolase)
MTELRSTGIHHAINELAHFCNSASKDSGWWHDPATGVHLLSSPTFAPYVVATKILLSVSELIEAMEGDRKGLMDDKLPHRSMLEVELADAVIRILDLGAELNLDVGGAIEEKMGFNKTRPDHQVSNRRKVGGKKY